MSDSNNTSKQTLFLPDGVKKSKDILLKERLRTLIKKKGMSEANFYNQIGLSRQFWYFISWGLWECPIHLKIKISKGLETDSSLIFQKQEEKDDN